MLFFLKQCARMILSFSNNELITSNEAERVPFNSTDYTTKIVWYDTLNDFPTNLSHMTVFIQLVGLCVTDLW